MAQLPILMRSQLAVAQEGVYTEALSSMEGEYETKLRVARLERDEALSSLATANTLQASYATTISELEAELAESRASHAKTTSELAGVVASRNEESSERRAAEEGAKEAREKAETLERDLEAARAWEAASRARINELESEMRAGRAAQALLVKRTEELGSVREELGEVRRRGEEENERANGLEREVWALRGEVEGMVREVEGKAGEIARMGERMAVLEEERERLRSALGRVEESAGETRDMLNASTTALEDEREWVGSLEDKISGLHAQLREAREAAMAAQQETLRLELDVKNSEAEAAIAIRDAQDGAAARVAEAEDRLAFIEGLHNQAKLELDITKIALSKADIDRVRLASDADMLPALQASLDQAASRHEELVLERDALHALLVAKAGVEEELEETRAALDSVSAQAGALQQKADRYESELASAREAEASARAELARLEGESSVKIQGLEAANAKLEAEVAAAGATVKTLGTQLEATHAKLETTLVDFNLLQGTAEEIRMKEDRASRSLATLQIESAGDKDLIHELRGTVEYLRGLCEEADAASERHAEETQEHAAQIEDLLGALKVAESTAALAQDAMAKTESSYQKEKERMMAQLGSAEETIRAEMEAAYQAMEIEHAETFRDARRGMDSLGAELRETRAELAATKARAEEMKASLTNTERFVTHYAEAARTASEELNSSRTQMEVVIGSRSELAARVQMLEAELTQARQESARLARELTQMGAAEAEARELAEDYESQLRELDTVVEASMIEKDEAMGYANQVMQGEAALSAELDRIRAEYVQMEEELKVLNSAHAEVLEAHGMAKAQLVSAQKVAATDAEERAQLSAMLDSARSQSAGQSQEVARLKDELRCAQDVAARVHELDKGMAVLQVKLDESERSRQAALVEAERARVGQDQAAAELATAQAQVRAAEAEVGKARIEADALARAAQSAPSPSRAVDASIAEERLGEARARMASLEDALEALHEKHAGVVAESAQTKAELEVRAAERISGLEGQVAALERARASAESEVRELSRLLSDTQAQVTTLSSENAKAETQLDHARERITELESRIGAGTRREEEAEREMAKLQAALKGAEAQVQETARDLAVERERLGVMERALEAARGDAKSLSTTMQAAEEAASSALENARREAARNASDAALELAKVQAALEAAKSELSIRNADRSTIAALERQLSECRKSVDTAQNAALAAETKASTLERMAEDARGGERRAVELRDAAESALREVRGDARDAERRVGEEQRRVAELVREVGELERRLVLEEQEKRFLENQVLDARMAGMSVGREVGSGGGGGDSGGGGGVGDGEALGGGGGGLGNEELMETVRGLAGVLEKSEEAIQRAKAQNRELRTQVRELEDALKIVEREKVASDRHRVELMQSAGAKSLRAGAEVGQLRQDLELERARAAQAVKEAKLLRAQLAQAKTHASGAASARIHDHETRMRRELDAMRADLGNLQDHAAALEKENVGLKMKVAEGAAVYARSEGEGARTVYAYERQLADLRMRGV